MQTKVIWLKAVASVVPMLGASLLLGAPDAWNAEGLPLALFGVGGVLLLANAVYLVVHQKNLVVQQRNLAADQERSRAREQERRELIEDDRTRRRCHALLREFHAKYLSADNSLRITVFLRNRHAGAGTYFVPIVRYRAADRANHLPESRARFSDNGSKNIRAVVTEPLQMVSCAVETQGMLRPEAEAWFVTQLRVDPDAAKLLSDETLFRTRSLGDIGMSFGRPSDGHHCFGWISFASSEARAFDASAWPAEQQVALGRFVREISCQLAPILDVSHPTGS